MKGKNLISRFLADEDGQSMVEYALIISLLAIAVLVAVFAMRNSTNSLYGSNADKIVDAMSSTH